MASDVSTKPKRILICDDDPLFRKTLLLLLKGYGTIVSVQNSAEALALLKTQTFDLLLLDIQMRTPDEGLCALPEIRAVDSDLTIVMLSGLKNFSIVREALRSGADDYLVKDFDPEEFRLMIERALYQHDFRRTNRKQNSEVDRAARKYRLIGQSAAIIETRKLAEKFRASAANVLIRGESGTGKEIVAHLLRKHVEGRGLEPFVAIDSATLHTNTAESLLFGHERGAFTGADQSRRGHFEEADGGVIFFDEVGNMPLEIQAKLLRVLQEKEILRLGSNRIIPLEFRVIAATSRPLEEMAKSGAFLPDLIHRLNILPITIAPLRERRDDLPSLVAHFLAEKTRDGVRITADALETLAQHDWPGNVRELSAMIDYSLAMIDGAEIDTADLHPKVRGPRPTSHATTASARPATDPGTDFYGQVARYEADLLRSAYTAQSGNISQIALHLGMDRSHLHAKLKQYGIHAPKVR